MAEIMFPLENTEYSAADAQLWFATRTSGVYTNGHLAVTEGNGMNVSVGKGIAWLNYGEFAGAVYGLTQKKGLTIPLADAVYPRIDRVVIRYDAVQNIGTAMLLQGTPASVPAAPAITRNENYYEISLAQIYVGKGVTEITAADITDERLDETVCGLMRDGVTGIDTSMILNQAVAALENVRKDANAILAEINAAYNNAISGTLAGDLQNAINQRPTTAITLVQFPSTGWTLDMFGTGNYVQDIAIDAYESPLDLNKATDDIIADVKIPNLYKDEVREAWAELQDFEITEEGKLRGIFFTAPTVNITISLMRIRKGL